MSRDTSHDLLPWYVAGTLDGEERESFRRHLEGCARCRDEAAFLGKLRGQIEDHGEAFLASHPSPERLVAAIRGEPDPDDRDEVLRHVALCADCALEARWIRGEAVAGPVEAGGTDDTPVRGGGLLFWRSLAAAALLVAAVSIPFALRDRDPTGVARIQVVRPAERTAGGVPRLTAGANATHLLFEIDLPRTAFPVEFTLLDDGHGAVVERPGILAETLLDGVYLFVTCSRDDCPPGTYTARIAPATKDDPPLTFRFALDPEADSP